MIIIIEEKQPNIELTSPMEVEEHKPIFETVKSIGGKVKWSMDYASEYYSTKKKYLENFDMDRFMQIIEKYDHVVLLGNWVFDALNLKYKSGRVYHMFGKKLIAGPSTLSSKSPKIYDSLLLAYQYETNTILHKDFTEFEVVNKINRLKEIAEYRHINKELSFDFETIGFDYFKDDKRATLLSITMRVGYSYIIPLDHPDTRWVTPEGERVPYEHYADNIWSIIREIMSDHTVHKIAHNFKFDASWLHAYGVEIKGRFTDTVILAHRLDSNRSLKLKTLMLDYFPFWKGYDDGVDYNGPLAGLTQYAALDTDITYRLFFIYENELLKEENHRIYRMIRNLDSPLIKVLLDAENAGVPVDVDHIDKMVKKADKYLSQIYNDLDSLPEVRTMIKVENERLVSEKIAEIKSKMTKHKPDSSQYEKYQKQIIDLKTGKTPLYTEVNFGSPQQMQTLIFDIMKIPVPKYRGEEKRTTDKDFLNSINNDFTKLLREYRVINKMVSTYYEGIKKRLDSKNYLHGTFKITGTVTGRLSSKNPNMQNMPSRISFKSEKAEEILMNIKRSIKPPEGYWMIQADLSQAELRMIASISGDPNMIQTYLDGIDIHAKTAAAIKGLPLDEFKNLPKDIYKMARYNAKAANFGQVYGISEEGYIEYCKNTYGLDIDMSEALKHKAAIYGTYTELKNWHKSYENKLNKHKEVETIFGYKRRFPDLHKVKSFKYSEYVRAAINTPIQGSSGQFMNFLLCLLYHRLPKEATIFSTIHDSTFIYFPKKIFGIKNPIDYICNIVDDTCNNPPLYEYFGIRPTVLKVPMRMDYEITDVSWRDMAELGTIDKVHEFSKEYYSQG